ncbi:MAG: methionine gamma-lyase family protein, partial [Christensenellaceae bacterium]|nr:methionine gamma-lyase family protein [Christensenellaceae bacterium]
GDRFLSVTGTPYDTIRGVIGIEGNADGSMKDFGIGYSEVALTSEGKMDIPAVMDALAADDTIKVVYIQRSRGYELRPSITIAEMEKLIAAVREKYPQICVAVDNCYGEFTEEKEPTEVGADIIMGSLIKNPGAGIAPSGGYIAGKKNYVEKIAGRFTAPGLGMEIGSYHSSYLPFFQGIYMAPHIVSQALMGVVLTAKVMEKLGYRVFPAYDAKRTDITQAVVFDTEEELVAFIRAVQKASPVDSNVVPYPWEMPGYEDPVIMAAGTFMQGGSIELSADAPIRKPYTAYMQGGMVYENVKLAVIFALEDLLK